MITIEATVPCIAPPEWAVLERALIAAMDQAVYPFLEKYTLEDGTLIWRESEADNWQTRDGADDFYESFYNWPLLYLLGGGDHLLPLAEQEWDAVTRQLTRLGLVSKEYERGYDQFHQGESYIYFYFLCLADPTNPLLVERARRFAGFYLNEDPAALNYDFEHQIIRAPHNGSEGPRLGYFDGEPVYPWDAEMRIYGLPYADVPGLVDYDDLKDPEKARRMGAVMQDRMGRGDAAVNLCVTSLVTNAFLLTGDEKYRRWVVDYVDAWRDRAARNGGLLPDNVGLSGQVGEYMDGKWYGGLYGWTWPHGFYNIAPAAIIAAANTYLLTGDSGYLALARQQIEGVLAHAETQPMPSGGMSLAHHWIGQVPEEGAPIFAVPYRYGDHGWFDFQPLSPIYPVGLWQISGDSADWGLIETLRQHTHYDWRDVLPFRNKEDAGHEQPWTRYLAGDNPMYPAAILRESYGQVVRRLAQIRRDDADLTRVNIHHWQELNPVLTEALVQLTMGAPQIVYNGGLLMVRVRYFDALRRRPGLPADVAALVEGLDAARTTVHLVNLSPVNARDVIVQAGAFGEHHFVRAHYDVRRSDYPGPIGSYGPPDLHAEKCSIAVDNKHLHVHLPPATQVTIDLELSRFKNTPSAALPWHGEGSSATPPVRPDQTGSA
ncbi:MAG: hypothetical protein JWO42_3360 [Chloroflexi bacterium]|nr:hypothetical protein [Chloroflexota bacterium]